VIAKLVFENLKNRPMRSLLSILLIAVPVTLILTLVGLSHGMLENSAQRARGVGADVLVRPPGTSLLSLSGAPLPEKIADRLEQEPHVRLAVGTITHPVQTPIFVTGVNLEKFNAMSGGFTFIEGGPFKNPDDIIIDRYYAQQQGVRAGGKLNMLNRDWNVAGVIEGGKLARIVLPMHVLQELTGNTGKISQVYLKLDDPANTQTVINNLRSLLEGYQIYSIEEFTSMYSVNNIAGLREFIFVIMAIGVIIGFAVVCLSMYMAVLQRTREIGILKSLGASHAFILRIVVLEAAILGLGGSVLGIIFSFGSWWLIRTLVPASIPMVIVPSWWPIAAGITLAGAALGALYPGVSAAQHDPIEALAYE
jgi:putative ABC transport system permease protein